MQIKTKDEEIANLQAVNIALSEKIADLQRRKMERHDQQSRLWRGRAIYYKRRAKALEERIKEIKGNGKIRNSDQEEMGSESSNSF